MYPHSHTESPTRRALLRSGITLLGGAAIASSGVALADECVLTPSDILGPMYNYGAPMFQKKLATDDEPGERRVLLQWHVEPGGTRVLGRAPEPAEHDVLGPLEREIKLREPPGRREPTLGEPVVDQ